MHSLRLFLLVCVIPLHGSLQGCACGAVRVTDGFGPANEQGDALHRYASSAKIRLSFESDDLDVDTLRATVSGNVRFLEAEGDSPAEDGRLPTLDLRTLDAGDASLTVLDASDTVIAEHALTIVDVDDVTFSVTAAVAPGLTLPAIDVANVRILRESRAAFRTTLLADGDEIFGFDAVTAVSSLAAANTRNGIAGDSSGDFSRNAVEVSVPASAVDPFTVDVEAGSFVGALTVTPTAAADVTALTLVKADASGADNGDTIAVVALPVVGAAPVFGAPVLWSFDGANVVDDDQPARGDSLSYQHQGGNTVDVVATFGDLSASTTVEGRAGTASVSSITFACGASNTPPLFMGLLALALLSRRRRACRIASRR